VKVSIFLPQIVAQFKTSIRKKMT